MTSLYKQSIPVCIKYLKNLSGLLEKSVKFADEKSMRHEEMLNFRLISDMKGLIFQVQSCCNVAKFTPVRVGGIRDTYFADDETTFEQLQGRITTTIELLRAVDEKSMDGKENEPTFLETKTQGTFKFESGQTYISDYALANFHFHLTTAYCILRHLGVPLSAMDYLGKDTFVRD